MVAVCAAAVAVALLIAGAEWRADRTRPAGPARPDPHEREPAAPT